MRTKTCSKCSTTKALRAFPPDGRTTDGLSALCADCRFASLSDDDRARLVRLDVEPARVSSYADLPTVDLDGIELMAVGGPYRGSGSPPEGDHFTVADLEAIAQANRELAGKLRVPAKIGHNRSQRLLRQSGLEEDEQPAVGWLENFRVAGGKLLADAKRVPSKFAKLVSAGAFRTRSVELGKIEAQDGSGKTWDAVVTGMAWLGAMRPAFRTIDDVVALYAETVEPVEALAVQPILVYVHASGNSGGEGADYKGVDRFENLNDEQVAALATTLGVQAPDGGDLRAAVGERLAVLAPTVAPTPTGETTPPPPSPAPPTPTPTPGPTPTPPPSPSEKAATQPPAPAPEPAAQPEPVAAFSAEERDRLLADAALGRRAYEERRVEQRDARIEAAIALGRITPAERDHWVRFADANADLAFSTLEALPINTTVIASTFGADTTGDAETRQRIEDEGYRRYVLETGGNPDESITLRATQRSAS